MASSQYRALEKRLYEIRDNHVLTIGKLDDIPCIPRQENIDRIWKAQEAKLEKAVSRPRNVSTPILLQTLLKRMNKLLTLISFL